MLGFLKSNRIAFAVLAVLALATFASPLVEEAQDTIVLDAAITKTCWDRHGFNFVSRWSCRSSMQRVGFLGLAVGCGLGKSKSDLCENAEKLSVENDERKARIDHVDGSKP
jgi:hypothetical protein